MTVKNISGMPYYTVDDIQRPEIKKFLIDNGVTLRTLSSAGHEMAQYLSKLTIDPESRAGLEDLMVLFGIVNAKGLEIRMLSAQLKHALNLSLEDNPDDI